MLAATGVVILVIALGTVPVFAQGTENQTASSPAGFPNATPSEAEFLFATDSSGEVATLGNDPPDLSGENPTYLDENTALIAPAGNADTGGRIRSMVWHGSEDLSSAHDDIADALSQEQTQGPSAPQLVTSELPLRTRDSQGELAPVDLSLEHKGDGYVPVNPLVDLKLPDSIRGGTTIGDDGIELDLGSNAASADPINGGQNLFYADAATDTDIVLAPDSAGLEALFQLRAPDSPEQHQMRFALPGGATLQAGDAGGAAITGADGSTLAAILPPLAHDANGIPVPVTTSIQGSTLVLDVPHTDPAISYPITVDPPIDVYPWYWGSTAGFGNWQSFSSSGNYTLSTYCTKNQSCTSGSSGPRGLYINAPNLKLYQQNQTAGWRYSVPHYPQTTAYITQMDLGTLYFNNRGQTAANPYPEAGIYAPSTSSFLAKAKATGSVSNRYWHFDAPSDLSTAVKGKQARFQLMMDPGQTTALYKWRDAYLGGAAITLGDTEGGTVDVTHSGLSFSPSSWSGWVESPWVDSVQDTVNVTASDGGLGVESVYVPTQDDPNLLDAVSENCTGTHASPCPQSVSLSRSYDTGDVPDGASLSGAAALDPLGKTDNFNGFVLRVDHTPPVISAAGGLSEAGTGDSNTLHVVATDGDASQASDHWQSGVRSIELDLNGQQVATTGDNDCTPEAGSCSLALDYAPDPQTLPSGTLEFEVIATDQLGHTQTQAWSTSAADVYHATEYDASPALGGTVQRQTWVKYGTQTIRTDDGTQVMTRSVVPCDGTNATPTCDEVRAVETFDGEAPSFLDYKSSRIGDPNLPTVGADFQPDARAGMTLVDHGPIGNALAAWQTLPPGHGSEYQEYEVEDDSDEDVYVDVWVDSATHYPLKRAVSDSASTDPPKMAYWRYDPNLSSTSSLPSDFFSVAKPDGPVDTEVANDLGAQPLGPQQDLETGDTFTPYFLGPHPKIAGVGEYCLVDSDLVTMTYAPGSVEPDPESDTPNSGAPETWVEANYRTVPDGGNCTPGEGAAPTPDLAVISEAGTSTDGTQTKALYKQIANDPDSGESPDEESPYTGKRDVSVGISGATGYAVSGGGGDESAVVPVGGTTITLDGTFARDDLNALAIKLRPR